MKFRKGDRVQHERRGVGTVLQVFEDAYPGECEYRVKFKSGRPIEVFEANLEPCSGDYLLRST